MRLRLLLLASCSFVRILRKKNRRMKFNFTLRTLTKGVYSYYFREFLLPHTFYKNNILVGNADFFLVYRCFDKKQDLQKI